MTRYGIISWSTSELNELSLSLPSLCTMHSALHNLLLNLKTSKWMIMHWVRLYLLYELGLISKSNAWDAYSQLWTLLTSLKAFAVRMMVSKLSPHSSTTGTAMHRICEECTTPPTFLQNNAFFFFLLWSCFHFSYFVIDLQNVLRPKLDDPICSSNP